MRPGKEFYSFCAVNQCDDPSYHSVFAERSSPLNNSTQLALHSSIPTKCKQDLCAQFYLSCGAFKQEFLARDALSLGETFPTFRSIVQGGSNMTGTNCDLFTHNQSRSYLNHLVLPSSVVTQYTPSGLSTLRLSRRYFEVSETTHTNSGNNSPETSEKTFTKHLKLLTQNVGSHSHRREPFTQNVRKHSPITSGAIFPKRREPLSQKRRNHSNNTLETTYPKRREALFQNVGTTQTRRWKPFTQNVGKCSTKTSGTIYPKTESLNPNTQFLFQASPAILTDRQTAHWHYDVMTVTVYKHVRCWRPFKASASVAVGFLGDVQVCVGRSHFRGGEH